MGDRGVHAEEALDVYRKIWLPTSSRYQIATQLITQARRDGRLPDDAVEVYKEVHENSEFD